jgi:hypothetical protein
MSKQPEVHMRNGAAFRRTGVLPVAVVTALLASLNVVAAQSSDAPMPGTLEAVAPAAGKSQAADPAEGDETATGNETSAQSPEPLDENQAAAIRDALSGKTDDEISTSRPILPVRAPSSPSLDWNRTANSDGTTYTVKRALPVDWDTKVGADLGVNDAASAPPVPALSGVPKNTGAAWANVQVPGVASFDARVGASTEPNKFGLSRTLPIGGMASLTLQGSYAMTETSSAAPAGPSPANAASVWSNDRQVKLNIAPTGTTFGVGASSSSADNITHNKLSAEQKLFDKFNVTTTLNDLGTSASSRSITAGFKTQW